MTQRFFVFLIIISTQACVQSRSAIYFNDANDTSFVTRLNQDESPIQPSDLLSIHISSLNQDASSLFNSPNDMATVTTTVSGHQEAGGYLVDNHGNVQLPLLGSLHIAGLTKTVLRDTIQYLLKERQLLTDPVVTIRYLNYEVTVVGEVGKPTVINVPNEKISLLKALGMAGDITIYGKKEQVLLIREQSGKRILKRLNLNTAGFIHSPYYYLQPGDIVYVEPNRHKIAASSGFDQYLAITLSGLSFFAIILTQVFK